MGRIVELNKLVANQIAAGEVVERPVSVIKELIENSLDALGQNIEISIKDGGISLIMVKDDGIGMDEDDIKLCTKRYATSKLKSVHDLNSLNTFGFRGEALPSVASISKLTIISQEQNKEYGFKAQFEQDALLSFKKNFGDVGTTIIISNLFYNIPARLKFIKSKSSESLKIENIIKCFLFSYKKTHFRFFKDDILIFDSKSLNKEYDREILLLGEDCRGYLYSFSESDNLLKIDGVYTAPMLTRRDNRSIKIFINHRYIEDKKIEYAILSAFRTLLEVGQKPICAINILVSPKEIDVNVHPRKMQIRFKDERKFLESISSLLSKSLKNTPWLSLTKEKNNTKPEPFYYLKKNDDKPRTYEFSFSKKREDIVAEITSTKLLLSYNFKSLRVIGQVLNTYLLLEGEQGLVVIDQHAAHERVMFEKIRKNPHDQLLPKSWLLAWPLNLEKNNLELLKEYEKEITSLGIEIDFLGEDRAVLRASPPFLQNINPDQFLKDILHELDSLGHPKSMHELYDHVTATIACHSAIRAGQKMPIEDIKDLLEKLDDLDIGAHCPHGRPVVKSFFEGEIKKWFHRT